MTEHSLALVRSGKAGNAEGKSHPLEQIECNVVGATAPPFSAGCGEHRTLA